MSDPKLNAPGQAGSDDQQPRRRRKSSLLGGEPRGDSGAPSFATTSNRMDLQHSEPSSPTSSRIPEKGQRGRKRKKMKSLLRRWKSISLRRTWLNPLILALAILAAFLANPTPSNPLHPLIMLSYPLPTKAGQPTQYGKGKKDFLFFGYYVIVLTFTREFIMQEIIKPLAIKAGIRNRAKQSRFMEQAYTAVYFAVFGPFGLYVMSRGAVWYFNTAGMYEGFPHRTHEALFKAYYLLQASYWAQQAIVMVLLLEKPRKDFKELVAHHIITLALIGLSYRFHFTYMGIAVYITHDVSDFFLATSKTLNYLDSPIVAPYYAMFIFIWTYLRHYINLRIIFSMFPLPLPSLTRWLVKVFMGTFPVVAKYAVTHPNSPLATTLYTIQQPIFPNWHSQFATVGSFELNWDTQQYKCWISQWITFFLLAALQSVNLFWLFFILRIAWRLVAYSEARDDRSEDESEEAEDDSTKQADKPSLLLNGAPLAKGESEKVGTRTSPRKR